MIIPVMQAQKIAGYGWPLDPPHYISGNYGELRPNHFHAGIDFSTRNKLGLPVYSVSDGYVSRIRVSPYGYGRCVYVTHPGGKTSVYAHLSSFSLKIADLVIKEQFLRKKFEVELLPRPNTLLVRKGEILGLSGNSGGSTGPHLHFEIRDQRSETPLNVLRLYEVPDSEKPVLQGLAFFDLSDTCAPLVSVVHKVAPVADSVYTIVRPFMLSSNVIGVGFAGFDKLSRSGNANNIYSAALTLDGRLIYSHELSGIDFADSRYVNEFSDVAGQLKFQKCFLPTLYPKGIYTASVNKGRVILADTLLHKLELAVADEYGNRFVLKFSIKAANFDDYVAPRLAAPLFVDCRSDFFVRRQALTLSIPKGTLYNCTPLLVENNIANSSKIVIYPDVNMRSASMIALGLSADLRGDAAQLVLRGGGQTYPGALKGDTVYFAVKNFGSFTLLADKQPPVITAPKTPKKMRGRIIKAVHFRITDKLSGIAEYNMLVNGEWALAEYDAKNDLLSYFFDDNTPRGRIRFSVEVSDKAGNKAALEHIMTRL